MDMIQPDAMIQYFNDNVLILTGFTADPYGLISDLSFLLSQFGAAYGASGRRAAVFHLYNGIESMRAGGNGCLQIRRNLTHERRYGAGGQRR
jgi:hypothetical protein